MKTTPPAGPARNLQAAVVARCSSGSEEVGHHLQPLVEGGSEQSIKGAAAHVPQLPDFGDARGCSSRV